MSKPENIDKEAEDFNKTYLEFRKETDVIKKFNLFLKLHCKDDYPHLIDSDDNAGEFMRQAIHSSNKRARIDELERIESRHNVNQYDCSILKMVVSDRLASLKLEEGK